MKKLAPLFLLLLFAPGLDNASSVNPGTPPAAQSVTNVSVTSANGFTGSVGNPTSNASITLTTSINSPVLAGDGTAITAATTTGSGTTVVLSNSATLVTPRLGTPASGTLTNCTGLPEAGLSLSGGNTTNDVSSTVHGFAPTGSNLTIPNCSLIGKSLGSGTSVAITISGSTATVTHNTHGYAINDIIVIAGSTAATIGNLNQLHAILSTTTNTYTFTTTASGSVTSPKESFWFSGTRSLNPTLVQNVTRASTGNVVTTFLSTQSDAFYGIYAFGQTSGSNLYVSGLSGTLVTTTACGFLFQNVGGASTDPTAYLILQFMGII
jgi:hypothetical protein